MAQFLEFEDKQVEDAVARASKELDIPRDKLKYDVISYGSSGIFGLVGIKKARIRVSVPSKKNQGKKRSEPTEPAEPAPVPETAEEPAEEKSEQEEIADTIVSLMEETFETPSVTEAPSPDPSEAAEAVPPDAETGVEPPPLSEQVPPEPSAEKEPSPPPEEEKSDPMELDPATEAALEKGREALQQIVDFITTDAQVVVERDADRVLFDVKGGNAGVLIGRRGQTLEAIQYLVEKIVNKNAENRIRIQVDIEGYLQGRRTRLEELAAKLSAKAKRSGKPVTLGQLNSHDRRIVHLSLRDDAAVRTQSQGDGFYRKLVIFPKKKGRKKKSG
jgi:spoIIIJ-associated protein